MNGVLIQISFLGIYLFSVILVVAFLWGAFVFFKKSVESHMDEIMVLDGVVLMAFWGFIFSRLFQVLVNPAVFWGNWIRILMIKNYPGVNYWGGLLGMVLALWLITKKNKLKFFDWFDYFSLGLVSGISWFLALSMSLGFSVVKGFLAIFFGLIFFWMWKIEKEYRTYAWYRAKKTQARSGLIGGMTLSVLGISQIVLSVGKMVNWVTMILGLGLFVGGMILVYIRSGRTLRDDLKIFSKK